MKPNYRENMNKIVTVFSFIESSHISILYDMLDQSFLACFVRGLV